MFIYCKPWIHYCIFTGLCAINPLDSYYSLYNGFHSSLKTWGKLAAGTQRLASRLFLKNPSCLCVNLLLGTKSNSIWQALFFTSTTRYLYTEIIPGLPRTHDSLKRPQILFFKCAVFFSHLFIFNSSHCVDATYLSSPILYNPPPPKNDNEKRGVGKPGVPNYASSTHASFMVLKSAFLIIQN